MKNKLLDKIANRHARVGIVGLGYVGLPLFLSFGEAGFPVVGFDIDKSKIQTLTRGESYIKHIAAARVSGLGRSGKPQYTSDYSLAAECDALIICVPTPLDKYQQPDISFIIRTTESLLPYLRKGQLLSLESTTYPGTTEEEILPRIESRGFVVGKDFFLSFSPERENPGDREFITTKIPKIVGGTTPECLEVATALFGSVVTRAIPVSSTKVAEMTKLLENIFRAVNIGLVNEMKLVAERMGIDIWEVIDAASTKPFGFTPFYPGPGWGGHCIPIDPFYLTWKAREYGLHTRFIELAGEVNNAMPAHVFDRVTQALNERGLALSRAKILVLGIAYKKNIDDMRESPAVKLMELLQKSGAELSYHDPYVPVFPKMRDYFFDMKSTPLKEALSGCDCAILVTDHDMFDYDDIRLQTRLIVDTRGRYRGHFPNVINA
jgi:UDP-N-acetyl-D-glucosamine dehydrogenase